MVEYVKSLIAIYGAEENEGQGLVEYSLILVLISIAAIVIMGTLGTTIQGVFTSVVAAL